MTRQRYVLAGLGAITALVLTGCGASAGSGSGSVQIDELVPLTGPSAHISTQDDIPGFATAVAAVNQAGGVLGRKLVAVETDSGADPADAVASVHQMLATHSSLSGVVGMTSDTGLVTGSLLNASKMVTITQAGTTALDGVHWPYVFRDFSPDSAEGDAMAAYALRKGWTHAAFLFGENGASQSISAVVQASYTAHGGTAVVNDKLPLDASSYESQIAQVVAAKPQVIFFETDPTTAATIFAEMKAVNNLSIPVVATSVAAEGPFWLTVQQAVGGYATMRRFMVSVTSPALSSGAAYRAFLKLYNPRYPKVPANPYINGNYDSVMILALAMDLANSTNPAVYVRDVARVVGNHSGTPIYTYKEGLAAIKAGKSFYYDTTQGPMSFNKNNSIAGAFVIQVLSSDQKTFETIASISDSEVKAYEAK